MQSHMKDIEFLGTSIRFVCTSLSYMATKLLKLKFSLNLFLFITICLQCRFIFFLLSMLNYFLAISKRTISSLHVFLSKRNILSIFVNRRCIFLYSIQHNVCKQSTALFYRLCIFLLQNSVFIHDQL